MTIHKYISPQGPIGTAVHKFDGVDVPPLFVPRLTETTSPNTSMTNINVRVQVNYPLASQVDGVWVADNSIKASFQFTALQNVKAETEKARVIDEMIAYLSSNKARIVDGSLVSTSE